MRIGLFSKSMRPKPNRSAGANGWVRVCLTFVCGLAIHTYAESVDLAWDANTDGITVGYYVYTANQANQVLSKQNVGAATTARVPNLAEATTYHFYVTAYSAEAVESLPSNTVTYTTPGPVNAPPVAGSFAVSTLEDTPVSVALQGSDPDGTPVQFSVLTSPARGTLSGTPPHLVYTPQLNFNGSDSFTYRVGDGVHFSGAATVSITVTPVNDPPTVSNLTYSTQQGSPVLITFAGSDPDNSTLNYSIGTSPSRGTLSGSGASRTYTPTAGYTGNDTFTYRASDGSLTSGWGTVTIQITAAPNSSPVASARSVETGEGQPVSVQLTGTDADGDSLTFSITSPPLQGTLTGTSPYLTYTPAAGYIGNDEFKFVASDGKATSPAATVSIVVTSAGGRIKFRRASYTVR